MERLNDYRQVIKHILNHYYEMTINQPHVSPEFIANNRLAFDETKDEYLLFSSAWEGKKRISQILVYLRIKDQKIWVEEDVTDLCVVDDLLAAGILTSEIVLGFHHPSKRHLTEFATA